MEELISFFQPAQKALFAAGPFFLLLGLLIFIHELGHFLVARWFGVKVEVFSLGFGPKILKYKKGDTIYCISLLPLGGYVKMFGDSPLEELPDSEKPKGFLYKKAGQKWLIAFGGPFMNLIFTFLAFFLLAFLGRPALPPELGDIEPDSKAWSLGFRSGDRILSVNEEAVSYYDELDKIINSHVGGKLIFKARSKKGEIKSLQAVPSLKKNPNPFEWKKFTGAIDGLSYVSIGLRAGVIYGSPAHKAGLRSFDEITQANNQKLRYWRDFKAFAERGGSNSFVLSFKRGSDIKKIKLKRLALSQLGIEPSFLYIDRLGPGSPADQAGLKKGDRLLAIDGKELQSWKQVLDAIQSSKGQALLLKYRRQGQEKETSLSPKPLFVEGNIKKRFMLGIASGLSAALPEEIVRQRAALQSLAYAGQETWKWLGYTATMLIRLIQGEFSLRSLGGPVMIGRAAHSHFHQGFSPFLFIMALISLNLFFFNLLPIPMLDGGHLLFFTIEGILGRALPVKKLILAQQLGLAFLASFMGFVFFNDIYNWLKAW